MSYRRAVWADDATVTRCTKCRGEFSYTVKKHHCRKCGLIFCGNCSKNRMIVPQDQLVARPQTGWYKISSELISDEDNYRCPQRVCDPCAFQLKDLQPELRMAVSRANQETEVSDSSKMPSMPSLDFHLEKEISKATQMLLTFKNTLGEEKIPRELLDIAKGVVFLTIVKVGFMFTGRYGTGLIVAKLPDGKWSAPSAVMITGVGWGLQVGAEVTEVMLILSTDHAVNTFKSKAQVTVGAELGVSVGPIGRGIASDVAASNKGAAHAFSYAQSKGLFFGASLEASGIATRTDVNRAFYGESVSISSLLCGDYPPPKGADPLYKAIDEVLFDISPSRKINGDEVTVTLNSPPSAPQTVQGNYSNRSSNPRFSDLNQYSDDAVPANNNTNNSRKSVKGTSTNKDILNNKIHEL